jgi:hypothetical protein
MEQKEIPIGEELLELLYGIKKIIKNIESGKTNGTKYLLELRRYLSKFNSDTKEGEKNIKIIVDYTNFIKEPQEEIIKEEIMVVYINQIKKRLQEIEEESYSKEMKKLKKSLNNDPKKQGYSVPENLKVAQNLDITENIRNLKFLLVLCNIRLNNYCEAIPKKKINKITSNFGFSIPEDKEVNTGELLTQKINEISDNFGFSISKDGGIYITLTDKEDKKQMLKYFQHILRKIPEDEKDLKMGVGQIIHEFRKQIHNTLSFDSPLSPRPHSIFPSLPPIPEEREGIYY